ncbi:Ran GTPase-activating protein 1 [Tanacetum coccineum]
MYAPGLVKKKEAEEQAKQIESSAFQTANQHFEKESDGDRESGVQVYAKESNTLMVEAVKKGPSFKGRPGPSLKQMKLKNF